MEFAHPQSQGFPRLALPRFEEIVSPADLEIDQHALLNGMSWPECFSVQNSEIKNPYRNYLELSRRVYVAPSNSSIDAAILGVGGALAPGYTVDSLLDKLGDSFGMASLRINLPGNDGTLGSLINIDEVSMTRRVIEAANELKRRSGANHILGVGLSAGGNAILAAQGINQIFDTCIVISPPLQMHRAQATKMALGHQFETMLHSLGRYSTGAETLRSWLQRLPIDLADDFKIDRHYREAGFSETEYNRPYMRYAPAIHMLHIERLRRMAVGQVTTHQSKVPIFAGFSKEDWVVNCPASMDRIMRYMPNGDLPSRLTSYDARHTITQDPRGEQLSVDLINFVEKALTSIAV